MNPLRADFQELYRRHLCRHSEFGINILHLVAVAGVYLAVFGIAFALPGASWIVSGVLFTYFLVLAANIPFRLLVVNTVVIGSLLTLFLMLPEIPVWIHMVLLVAWHRFQVWQHKIYHRHSDMSQFEQKYQKGWALSVLLAVYELPILLNFLVLEAKDRKAASPG